MTPKTCELLLELNNTLAMLKYAGDGDPRVLRLVLRAYRVVLMLANYLSTIEKDG